MTINEPNNPKLKLAVARLLPELLTVIHSDITTFIWNKKTDTCACLVVESEWLYVVHLVEQTLNEEARYAYGEELECQVGIENIHSDWSSLLSAKTAMATFNQRATALCKVKNIEVL